jgi:hypothetical protein
MELISSFTMHPTGIAESVGAWNDHNPYDPAYNFVKPPTYTEDEHVDANDYILFTLDKTFDWSPYGPHIEIDHLTLLGKWVKNHNDSHPHNIAFYLKMGGIYYTYTCTDAVDWGDGDWNGAVNVSSNPVTGQRFTVSEINSIQGAGIIMPTPVPGGVQAHIGYFDVYGQAWYIPAPYVHVQTITETSPTEVTLDGHLSYSEGEDSECWFEWGLTTAYGNSTAHLTLSQGQYWSADITGLEPGNAYHCRAVASSGICRRSLPAM